MQTNLVVKAVKSLSRRNSSHAVSSGSMAIEHATPIQVEVRQIAPVNCSFFMMEPTLIFHQNESISVQSDAAEE